MFRWGIPFSIVFQYISFMVAFLLSMCVASRSRSDRPEQRTRGRQRSPRPQRRLNFNDTNARTRTPARVRALACRVCARACRPPGETRYVSLSLSRYLTFIDQGRALQRSLHE